jgi:Methyltransferase FkbM domain
MDKAAGDDFMGRFREVISDPTNLLIDRGPLSGAIFDGLVVLHNGMRVPMDGPYSYYGSFNQLLVVNRGVHEPLEEFVFQQLLKRIGTAPLMLELGAYWGHYSMWLKSRVPGAKVILVEPEDDNLEAGKRNFIYNKLTGEFIKAFVGKGHFSVDEFFKHRKIEKLNILHSDIQGFELEMLNDAAISLAGHKVDYVFLSSHSQDWHHGCARFLKDKGYRVEVSSDFDIETTSNDGFMFASSPKVKPLFNDLVPFNRSDLVKANSEQLMQALNKMRRACL